MRHRLRGRHLGRTDSHRQAMFRNMAVSLIHTVNSEQGPGEAAVKGRIVTTLAKAKQLRPFVEKLVTLGRHALDHEERAREFATTADKGSESWRSWRDSSRWQQWNQAIAPAVTLRRRAFALLRDAEAVRILFEEVAPRYRDRPGGYTRIIRLATPRLGDAGPRAIIEFVGERDRVTRKRVAPVVVEDEAAAPAGAEPTPTAEAAATQAAESQPEKT